MSLKMNNKEFLTFTSDKRIEVYSSVKMIKKIKSEIVF